MRRANDSLRQQIAELRDMILANQGHSATQQGDTPATSFVGQRKNTITVHQQPATLNMSANTSASTSTAMNLDMSANTSASTSTAVDQAVDAAVEQIATNLDKGDFACVGPPIDYQMPDKLKAQIRQGDFVEFANILTPQERE
jgi:hypothetical protein